MAGANPVEGKLLMISSQAGRTDEPAERSEGGHALGCIVAALQQAQKHAHHRRRREQEAFRPACLSDSAPTQSRKETPQAICLIMQAEDTLSCSSYGVPQAMRQSVTKTRRANRFCPHTPRPYRGKGRSAPAGRAASAGQQQERLARGRCQREGGQRVARRRPQPLHRRRVHARRHPGPRP